MVFKHWSHSDYGIQTLKGSNLWLYQIIPTILMMLLIISNDTIQTLKTIMIMILKYSSNSDDGIHTEEILTLEFKPWCISDDDIQTLKKFW